MSNHRSASTPQNACTPEKVKELADAGHGRNAIAELLGVTTYRVDKAARAAGVKFDRTATRKAVEARQVDAHAEREELATQFREVARTILTRVLDSEGMETNELRDLIWSAGAAASSDVRIGKLALDRSRFATDERAAEDFADILEAVRSGFEVLDDIDAEELQARIAAQDEAQEAAGGDY